MQPARRWRRGDRTTGECRGRPSGFGARRRSRAGMRTSGGRDTPASVTSAGATIPRRRATKRDHESRMPYSTDPKPAGQQPQHEEQADAAAGEPEQEAEAHRDDHAEPLGALHEDHAHDGARHRAETPTTTIVTRAEALHRREDLLAERLLMQHEQTARERREEPRKHEGEQLTLVGLRPKACAAALVVTRRRRRRARPVTAAVPVPRGREDQSGRGDVVVAAARCRWRARRTASRPGDAGRGRELVGQEREVVVIRAGTTTSRPRSASVVTDRNSPVCARPGCR